MSLGAVAHAQSQPGRFLFTARPDIILQCNLDGSNCFHVTGASQAAGDPGGGIQMGSTASQPSRANDGTIAFTALYGVDGSCSGIGGQGICRPHIFLMDPDGANIRQITFNPSDASNFNGDNYAAISPDGTMVAFVSNRNIAAYDTNNNPVYVDAVFVVNADGTGLRQVTPFTYDNSGNTTQGGMQSVAWSPDSTKLAFKGIIISGPVCGYYENNPAWPTACEIVGKINVDGTGVSYFAPESPNAAGQGFAIDWSPDGTLIAYVRNTDPSFGEPVIAIIDLAGNRKYGLTNADLGTQSSAGQHCPADRHCIHFSPDGTRLAYTNNSPTDNTGFYGISTINLDTTGRVDSLNVGKTYSGYGLEGNGIWWAPGPALPAAAQLTLAPSTAVEVWPGFSQQLTPSLLDANNNLIMHTAQAYHIVGTYWPTCTIQIGPYGLAMFVSVNNPSVTVPTISAANAGLTSNSVEIRCWASPPCTYNLVSSSENFGDSGGSDSVGVTADPGTNNSTCPWNAVSNASWIKITSSTGSGNGTVNFTVAANNTGQARQGTMTIAGATFTVNQSALPTLQSISVSPSTASVPAGLTQQFTATGHYSNNSTQDLTSSVTWSSSNTGIASISNSPGTQGLATGVAAGGPVTITATMGSISGPAQLTVDPPVLLSLSVAPTNPSMPAGSTQQFTATGTYSDGSTQNITSSVTWASSNPVVASIGASGSASALTAGTTAISASQGSVSNSTTMTVVALQSLTISPLNPSMFVGSTLQFVATGHYSDGSTRDLTSTAAWTSSKASVATITSPGGLATGNAKGSTTIKAVAGGFSASTTLKVNAVVLQSITVTPATATISVGGTQQFTATGTYNNGAIIDVTNTVTWSSSPKQVASVNSTGLATGLKAGTATISAKSGGTAGSATLTVH